MCGITAGIARREVAQVLLDGLKRLEYRGYDSAGLALLNDEGNIVRLRVCGKVNQLQEAYNKEPIVGKMGVAHTRWATHGRPSEVNAHPHMFKDTIALVHNGIIENYVPLQKILEKSNVSFSSQTDSEVIVQWIGHEYEKTNHLLQAVQATVRQLEGAYSIAVMCRENPDSFIAARQGSPLLIGVGEHEHFVASDALALLPITQRFVTLEDGDVAEIFRDSYVIYDRNGQRVERKVRTIDLAVQSADRGKYRHFMQKEIFEQPEAIRSALAGRLHGNEISDAIFGSSASELLDRTKRVQIVACGTSYHAGLVARYWLEQIAGVACQVEVASEFRYRRGVVHPGTLLVTLSQSGETADTLAALRHRSSDYVGSLAICNVPESSLVRESGAVLLTHAGPEIGVASTKAFTTQLVSLLMLVQCLGKRNDKETTENSQIVQALRSLPQQVDHVLQLDEVIAKLAQRFDHKQHALFIARGIHYPIVREGALKLKEISYIHAEAYPAGELKHGPLALVDKHMPVVAIVPHNALLDKMMSNLQEVRARQGELIVLTEEGTGLVSSKEMTVIEIPAVGEIASPILFTILLQLLAYHVAVAKGTDVDQPRNLAKSVTVE